jgi:hypothetical protein
MADQRPGAGFDFTTLYSKRGRLHKWVLNCTGEYVASGLEKTREKAREQSRIAKDEYVTRLKAKNEKARISDSPHTARRHLWNGMVHRRPSAIAA